MNRELPPQFYDDTGEEQCPSCIATDACGLKDIIDGLFESDTRLRGSVRPETVNTELIVDGAEKVVKRRQSVEAANDAVSQALAARCLLYAQQGKR